MNGLKKMDRPFFSIITVCLNDAVSLSKTIESIKGQKTEEVEYLVIDGGSSDGTIGVVESFSDCIDFFLSEPDEGIADAFNKGVLHSRGEIVSLINAGDSLLPDALSQVKEAFLHNGNIDVVHGDLQLCTDNGVFLKKIRPPRHWWYPWRLVFINHPTVFVKKELYERVGLFDPDYKIAMDVEIFFRWKRANARLFYIAKDLAQMEIGGVSDVNALAGYREVYRAVRENGVSRLLAYLHYLSRLVAYLFLKVKKCFR